MGKLLAALFCPTECLGDGHSKVICFFLLHICAQYAALIAGKAERNGAEHALAIAFDADDFELDTGVGGGGERAEDVWCRS